MKRRNYTFSRGMIFTLFCDNLSVFVFFFMIVVATTLPRLKDAEQLASLLPGLTDKLHQSEVALGLAVEVSAEKSGIIDGLEKEAAGNRRRLEVQGKKLIQLTGDLEKTIERLRSGPPVRLVFCLDVTKSMQSVVDELRDVLATVFETLPNTSKKCEICVLAFRHGVVKTLELTEVKPTYEDERKSQKKVLDWIDELHVEEAHTEHLSVFREAIKILRSPSTDETRHRLIILGDVGPAELDKTLGYSAAERAVQQRILQGVGSWVKQRPNNAVEALYADSDWSLQDPYAKESRDWFEALGSVSADSASYNNTSSLLRAVLHASLN
ncbi:MAG: hypothetical protein Aurels2KO_53960 [Aureliella sp.]